MNIIRMGPFHQFAYCNEDCNLRPPELVGGGVVSVLLQHHGALPACSELGFGVVSSAANDLRLQWARLIANSVLILI